MFERLKRKRPDPLELRPARAEEFIGDALSFRAGMKATTVETSANPYQSREHLVAELVRKYKGYADAGNQLIQRIVDTRAAFALAGGLSARAAGVAGEAELEFIRHFIRENQLDGQFGQQLAVEKELEGQVLLVLDRKGGSVRVRFVSWNDTHYEVRYADDSYTEIEWIEWDGERGRVRVAPEQAVFIKFNARIHSREGVPTLSGLLPEAEDIDRALRDWRKINRYFASPTPYFKTRDIQEAKDLYDRLLAPGVDWRIGKVFVGPAEFSLVSMTGDGCDSIRQEIETKVKILAGGAGVPVQFLGFPEFMSNRATAENTLEPVALVSIAEQRSWLVGFTELFDKAIALEAAAGADLAPGRVLPVMRFVTRAQLDSLRDLYLPLWQSGAIPLETLLRLLPDFDPGHDASAAEAVVSAVEEEKDRAPTNETAAASDEGAEP